MTKVVSRTKDSLTQADYRHLAEFRYLIRRFLIFSEAAAREASLTARQHQAILMIMAATRGLSMGVLAERLGLRPHSTVGLVDRLVAKRLIKRTTARDDRRKVLLTLTPKARGLLRGLSAAHRDELKRLAPLLRKLLRYFGSL